MKKFKSAIGSLLATVKCAWSLAVFNFEQWLDGIRYPDGRYLANAVAPLTDPGYPNAVGRHLKGIISYFCNSTQTLATTAPWTNRYQVVIFGNDAFHCYLSGTAGEVILGIAMDSPYQAGEPVEVAIPDAFVGTCLAYASGVIAAGTLLKSNGDGSVAAWTSGSTTCCIGVALTAATALGDYIEVSLSLSPGSGQTAVAISGASFTF